LPEPSPPPPTSTDPSPPDAHRSATARACVVAQQPMVRTQGLPPGRVACRGGPALPRSRVGVAAGISPRSSEPARGLRPCVASHCHPTRAGKRRVRCRDLVHHADKNHLRAYSGAPMVLESFLPHAAKHSPELWSQRGPRSIRARLIRERSNPKLEPVGGDDMSFDRNRWHGVHVGPWFGSEKEFPPPAPSGSRSGS